MSEIWTARVRIGGVSEGDPPLLAFSEIVQRPNGERKLISQMAQIRDVNILTRLREEAHNGEEAEVVVEQHIAFSILRGFTIVGAKLDNSTTQEGTKVSSHSKKRVAELVSR